jgi:hypothetical protein
MVCYVYINNTIYIYISILYHHIYIYIEDLRAAALAADPGKECEDAEGGPRPRFCFLVAAESNGSCKGIGLPRVGDTAQLSQTKIAAGVGSLLR